VLLVPLIFMANCEKEPSLPGVPGDDNIAKLDSIRLIAFTLAEEAKDALNEGDVVIGKLEDPRFGTSIASFYAQFRLTTTDFSPGANPILDSAFLELEVESAYGPLSNSIDFEIYRLTEALVPTNTYFSDDVLSSGSSLLGGLTGFTYNGESRIRIPITSAFSSELFSLFGTSEAENNTNFLAYLNGLYISVNNASGGDGLIDVDATASSLKLYFRSDLLTDSLYTFAIDEQSLRVNQFITDLSGSELETALNDPSNDDQNVLLGGLQVSKGSVTLPDLSVLEGSIINQARLTFYQTDYGDAINTAYSVPEFLLLTGSKDNDTIVYFLADYSTTQPTRYGGIPFLADFNGSPTIAYSFSLPIFFQRLVNQETDINSLNIEVLNYNNGNRVKLGGGNHPDFPIQLEILYTKP
jgi:hypothetical protein